MAKKESKETPTLRVVKNENTEPNTNVNKPTPEEIEQYKEEFNVEMKKFAETRFPVSEPGSFKANNFAIFFKNYLDKYVTWKETEWMGVIKMDETIDEALKAEDIEEVGLALDYQSLEVCGYLLMRPGGIGLEAAKGFEKQADEYSAVIMEVGKKIEEAREQLKHVQYLQERWAAAEQGFYLADLEKTAEEEKSDTEKSE